MELDRLLKFGFFPKELPPPFTTSGFGDFAAESGGFPTVGDQYMSRASTHNLARPGNQRRVLSLLNPFNFYKIANLLSENRMAVSTQLRRSNISLTKPQIDLLGHRAYVPRIKTKRLLEERIGTRSDSRFIVRSDISRFYPSIYTHSIPWALMGKAWSKEHKSGGFANDLDKFIRNSQDGQTLGLPIGPDTSFIVSELIASAIDEAIQNKGLTGFRFVDDFEFGFLSRSQAEQALPTLEAILFDFELALNPSKTFIDQLPTSLENSWRLRIKRFPFPKSPSANELIEYFDLLFNLYNKNHNEPVLRYGIARLRSLEIADEDVLINLLFQCILAEPGTLKESLLIFEIGEIEVHKAKIESLIKTLIGTHGPMNHGSEVAWALWTAIRYNVDLPDATLDNLKHFSDPVVALLALHAHEKGLVSNKTLGYWQDLMTKGSFKDGNWLIAYEADVKGWLPSIDGRNHVESDPLFRVLKENGISFYNKDVNYTVSEKEASGDYDDEDEDEEDEEDDDEGEEDDREFN